MTEVTQLTIFDTIFGELIEKYDPKIADIKVYGILDAYKNCKEPYFMGNYVFKYLKGSKTNTYRELTKFKGKEIKYVKVKVGKYGKQTCKMLTKYGLIRAIALCGKETKAHICFRELIYKLFDQISETPMEHTLTKYHAEMVTTDIQSELAQTELTDPGLVYFIRRGDSDSIKVGRTTNLKDRLSTLQTGSEFILTVVRTIHCTSDYTSEQLEDYLHKKFKRDGHHIRGEWFNLTDIQIHSEIILV